MKIRPAGTREEVFFWKWTDEETHGAPARKRTSHINKYGLPAKRIRRDLTGIGYRSSGRIEFRVAGISAGKRTGKKI